MTKFIIQQIPVITRLSVCEHNAVILVINYFLLCSHSTTTSFTHELKNSVEMSKRNHYNVDTDRILSLNKKSVISASGLSERIEGCSVSNTVYQKSKIVYILFISAILIVSFKFQNINVTNYAHNIGILCENYLLSKILAEDQHMHSKQKD
ncbi:hypothetical protein BDC45DRAFT_532965 [Circinella umbellata]|nr:hypothetical protein BDC45DRAFT_532965 [Circinella umbellata]